MEATIDPNSRLLYAVVEIEDPFAPNKNNPKALRRGQFVTAEIEGRGVSDAYVLPRYALRSSDTVYIVSEAGTLETRTVTIIKCDAEKAIITEGLKPGERVAISPVAYYIENMPVEVIE